MAFLFSCEKAIEFNGDEVKTKLVLDGLLSTDSIVKIRLTESRFFLEDDVSFKKIDNATVELWKEGNKIENLSNIGDGYYVGTYVPGIGDKLRITASCEGLDPIECSTEIAMPSPIVSVDTMNVKEDKGYNYSVNYDPDTGISTYDSTVYSLVFNFDMNITFKDPKDITNYYVINIYQKFYLSDGRSLFYPIYYGSDDMIFHTGNDMNFLEDDPYYLQSTLFNDELFDGKEYKLKIKTNNYDGIGVGINPDNPDKEILLDLVWDGDTWVKVFGPEVVRKEILVELQSLSPEFFMFRKTRDADFYMDETMKYFTEPIQIYSNVKGGIGILGSYSSSFYTIPLK